MNHRRTGVSVTWESIRHPRRCPRRDRAGAPGWAAATTVGGPCWSLWILAIIGITVVAQVVGTHFQNKFTAGNTPSQQAADILQASFPSRPGDTADVVFHTATPIAANRGRHQRGRATRLRPLAARAERYGTLLTAMAPTRSPPHANIAFAHGPVLHRRRPTCRPAPSTTSSRRRRRPQRPGFQVELGGAPDLGRGDGGAGSRARASASRPPSSSCCWPSARSWRWACP